MRGLLRFVVGWVWVALSDASVKYKLDVHDCYERLEGNECFLMGSLELHKGDTRSVHFCGQALARPV